MPVDGVGAVRDDSNLTAEPQAEGELRSARLPVPGSRWCGEAAV
jgi:hypothetical protein